MGRRRSEYIRVPIRREQPEGRDRGGQLDVDWEERERNSREGKLHRTEKPPKKRR